MIDGIGRNVKFFIFIILGWFTSSALILIFCFTLLLTQFNGDNPEQKYSIFAAKPLVLGETTTRIEADDARATALNKVFEKYKCPIQGNGDIFVEEADKNNIPYWLVASIAFQESSCGKNTPTKNGVESNNLWGWAVYGSNVKMFNDLNHGVAVVSKYMHDTFYSKGITELCDIMKIYTPPSNGSWCRGVAFFRDEILGYETPTTYVVEGIKINTN